MVWCLVCCWCCLEKGEGLDEATLLGKLAYTLLHSYEAGLVSRNECSTVEWDSGYPSPCQGPNSPLVGLSLMFSGEGMLRTKNRRKASPVVMIQ